MRALHPIALRRLARRLHYTVAVRGPRTPAAGRMKPADFLDHRHWLRAQGVKPCCFQRMKLACKSFHSPAVDPRRIELLSRVCRTRAFPGKLGTRFCRSQQKAGRPPAVEIERMNHSICIAINRFTERIIIVRPV